MLGNILGAVRDRAAEAAAKSYISGKIRSFGEVTRLDLDSTNKTIRMEVRLEGEVSPVEIAIGRYDVTRRNDEAYLTVREAQASRPWITSAVREFIIGREFKIPSAAASVL